jgi:hypothetical protein
MPTVPQFQRLAYANPEKEISHFLLFSLLIFLFLLSRKDRQKINRIRPIVIILHGCDYNTTYMKGGAQKGPKG